MTALGAEWPTVDVRGTTLRADDLLSGVRFARDEAQRKLAINCLKQIALAMKQYHEQYGHYPPAIVYDKTGKVPHSWRVELLPFLLEQELYDAYKMNEPWDSPNNQKLLGRIPSAYLNPVTREDKTHASFYAITGEGTAFANNKGTTQEQVTDGASRSLMVVETKLDIPWTKPEDIPYDAQGEPLELGGNFVGGFHALMCDGTIKYLANDDLTGLVQRVELAGLSANIGSTPPAGNNPANPPLNFDLHDDARRRRTIGNLTIVAQALRLYHNQHGHFPPANSRAKNSKYSHSWRVDILPFLLLKELYDQYKMDEPWDSENNKQVLAKMPAFFRSPDDSGNSTNTACFIITGTRAVFDGTKRPKLEQIKDGAESTLLVVEAKRDVPWTKPEDVTYDPNGERQAVAVRQRFAASAGCSNFLSAAVSTSSTSGAVCETPPVS